MKAYSTRKIKAIWSQGIYGNSSKIERSNGWQRINRRRFSNSNFYNFRHVLCRNALTSVCKVNHQTIAVLDNEGCSEKQLSLEDKSDGP